METGDVNIGFVIFLIFYIDHFVDKIANITHSRTAFRGNVTSSIA